MNKFFSQALDKISDFFSERKGLLPIIGIILIVANFIILFTGETWLSQTNFLLHLGIIIAIFGFMVARAL